MSAHSLHWHEYVSEIAAWLIRLKKESSVNLLETSVAVRTLAEKLDKSILRLCSLCK